MKLILKNATLVWDWFDEHLPTIKTLLILFLGVWPAITVLLEKYSLNIEYFYFGVAGQGVFTYYRFRKDPTAGLKYLKNVVFFTCNLIMAGFVSMLTTGLARELYFHSDNIYTAVTSATVGASYEVFIKVAVTASGNVGKLVGKRITMAFEVLINGKTKE